MANCERYQIHCQFCHARVEADTIREALRKVEEREREKHSAGGQPSTGGAAAVVR